MRILLIEDSITDIQAFKTSARAWSIGKAETIEVEECVTLESAFSRLSSPNDLDGIILDLKLPHEANGEEVIKRIGELYLRIPIVVLSGTPSELDDDYQAMCLKCFIKGEQHERQILDLLWDCKRSGLMDLIGGKGLFEKHLKTVFDKCIVPRFDDWRNMMKTVEPDKADTVTSEALSRHVLTCLGLLLSNDTETIQPEECYVLLPDEVISCPRPGMILKDSNEVHYLVLNPACDLAIRSNGSANSDVMLLVPIDSERDTLKALMGRLCPRNKRGIMLAYERMLIRTKSRFDSIGFRGAANLKEVLLTSVMCLPVIAQSLEMNILFAKTSSLFIQMF